MSKIIVAESLRWAGPTSVATAESQTQGMSITMVADLLRWADPTSITVDLQKGANFPIDSFVPGKLWHYILCVNYS